MAAFFIRERFDMYKLSSRSLNNLRDVDANLVKVVKRAIEITKQDFTIIEGTTIYLTTLS